MSVCKTLLDDRHSVGHTLIPAVRLSVFAALKNNIPVRETEADEFDRCLACSNFVYIDPSIKEWFAGGVPSMPPGDATLYRTLRNGLSFGEVAQSLLGETTRNLSHLAALLVRRRKTFSIKQLGFLISEAEEESINCFFVQDNDAQVHIVGLHRSTSASGEAEWYLSGGSLGFRSTWRRGLCLFVRN